MKSHPIYTIDDMRLTLVKHEHTFFFPDNATSMLIIENIHGYTFDHLENARVTVRPHGTCHDNRFNTLREALEKGIETYKDFYHEL